MFDKKYVMIIYNITALVHVSKTHECKRNVTKMCSLLSQIKVRWLIGYEMADERSTYISQRTNTSRYVHVFNLVGQI